VPAVPVVATVVKQKDVPVRIDAIGAVEPIATVAIKPQVGGVITEVHFKEGMDVKQGDMLFTIDPRPYQAALHQSESNLVRDEANARNAKAEAQRSESLFAQGILSTEQHDQLRAAADAAEAAAQADRAAVERARLDLEYCAIRAPIDGRTGSLLVHRGNLVKAIDGGPLVVINRFDPIYVSFAIPEKRLPEVKAAREARTLEVDALVQGDEGRPVRGELTFVDNSVDRETGTIRLKGLFPNGDRRLWPGLFVKASLTLGTRAGAVVVPTEAVQAGQTGPFVYVIKADQTAEARPVVVDGEAAGESVVIKGLEAGEKVVTDGQLRLVPGAKVEMKAAPGAPSPEGARS
jgi:multidrug efflux system membrane fusion protein